MNENQHITSEQPFATVHQNFKEERKRWIQGLDRSQRTFVEISRSTYIHKFRPLWLENYQAPWFFNADCNERQVLVSAGLMYRIGNYVLMPSMLWLCQIDQTKLLHLPLAECIQQTGGFRFNLWYGRMHPDFISLPILPSRMTTVDLQNEILPEVSSIKPMCTFMDLDRDETYHLKDVEQRVRQWFIEVGHWSTSPELIKSFFHIPPPDSPKSTLHLHMVAGKELELEYNYVFYRVPLSILIAEQQPSFIVDITRWQSENRSKLLHLASYVTSMPRVYGIVGCTCSGKSELVTKLSETYDVELVSQDDFFVPEEQLPRLSENELSVLPTRWPQKKNIDRSHPNAIDWPKLINHIESLKHTTEKRFILVEGNLLLSQPMIRDMLDRILFIDVPESRKHILMQRRMNRARPGCLSEVQIGMTEAEYMPYFDLVWQKYNLHGQACFQVNHIDFELSTETKISFLASWFTYTVDDELNKCQTV